MLLLIVTVSVCVTINSNGDSYEGDWINGLQHGHGIQRCADGTVYTVSVSV